MNDRDFKKLAARKGLGTTSISGLTRVIWANGTTSTNCLDAIKRLSNMPEFDLTKPAIPSNAVDLTGKSPEERDAIILQMQAGALS
jgi:uncharacterized membrane protein YjjP (DUF1212 family)